MKNIFKIIATLVGALAAGGFIGWAFGKAGMSTPVSVAVILAIFSGCCSAFKKKKIAGC